MRYLHRIRRSPALLLLPGRRISHGPEVSLGMERSCQEGPRKCPIPASSTCQGAFVAASLDGAEGRNNNVIGVGILMVIEISRGGIGSMRLDR